MLVYATTGEYEAWTGAPAPGNITALLRSASLLVRRATRTGIYTTTPTGLPSDPDIAGAFRDATIAQAAAWETLGIDPTPGAAGVAGSVQASSIGSGSVTRTVRPGQDDDRAATVEQLVPDAAGILADIAHLIGTQPIAR